MKHNFSPLFFLLIVVSILISSCADLSTKAKKSTNHSVELHKNEAGVTGDQTNTVNQTPTDNLDSHSSSSSSSNSGSRYDDQLNPTATQDPYDHTKINARTITQINPKTFVLNFADQNEKALILVGMLKYWESRGKKSFYVMVNDETSKFLIQLLKVYQKKGSANLVEWVIFQKLKKFFPRKSGETESELSQQFEDYAGKLEDDFNLNLEPDPIFGNCERLMDLLEKDRKAVCFSSRPQAALISKNMILYQLKLPENYLTQFTLADYLSYGQKIAKELLGKLK
ncbi:MAG: hypothetical protein QE271_06670 [Bacteriovoracaceae bacterium]|nr:hypothetical protein [Bacteriovoracaceae bacterium]